MLSDAEYLATKQTKPWVSLLTKCNGSTLFEGFFLLACNGDTMVGMSAMGDRRDFKMHQVVLHGVSLYHPTRQKSLATEFIVEEYSGHLLAKSHGDGSWQDLGPWGMYDPSVPVDPAVKLTPVKQKKVSKRAKMTVSRKKLKEMREEAPLLGDEDLDI